MPYKIEARDGQQCVVNSETGKQVACHPDKKSARAQVKALYANEAADAADCNGIHQIVCIDADCTRVFLGFDKMEQHVVGVHDEESRDFNTKQRDKLAKKGKAMPHGGFPIVTAKDLANAIQAYGRAKDKAAAKAHIIKRAKALGLTKKLPKGWTSDSASLDEIQCLDCPRTFLDVDRYVEHAEAVHTFSDIEELVRDAVRDKYNREGDYKANPPVRSIYAWVRDTSADWVVFEVNEAEKGTLYKASYSITDGIVTLGERTEVVRKTVYEPVKEAS